MAKIKWSIADSPDDPIFKEEFVFSSMNKKSSSIDSGKELTDKTKEKKSDITMDTADENQFDESYQKLK